MLKEQLLRYGFRFGKTIRREGSFIVRPVSVRQVCLGTGNIALIGEAAGWISPSSAEGFSYAFKSSVTAAAALEPGPDGFLDRYRRDSRMMREAVIMKNLKSKIIFNPALRRGVMKTGIGSMEMYLI